MNQTSIFIRNLTDDQGAALERTIERGEVDRPKSRQAVKDTAQERVDPGQSLVDAISDRDLGAQRAALAAGADVNAFEADGTTPLMWAVMRDHPPSVALLLEAGADPDLQDPLRMNALNYAVTGEDVESAALLIPHTQKFDAPNKFGMTPLMQAASRGLTETVGLLIDRGADVNARFEVSADESDRYLDGATPLMFAAHYGKTDAVRLLLASGADVTAQAKDGYTAAAYAVTNGHFDTFAAIRDHVQVHALSGAGKVDLIDEHVAHALEKRDEFEQTPLLRVAAAGDVAAASALINAGANVNAADDEGSRPLHRAAYHGHTEVVALLLKHGADATARDNYKHSVHMNEMANWATQMGFEGGDSASVLAFESLDKERLIAPRTEEGRTPLMVAEHKGHGGATAMLRAHALAAAIDAQPIAAKPEPPRQWPEPFAGPDESNAQHSQVRRGWPKPFTGPDDTSPEVRGPAEQRAARRRL